MTHIKTHEELLNELYEAIAADAKELGVYPEYKDLTDLFYNMKTTLDLYHDVTATLRGNPPKENTMIHRVQGEVVLRATNNHDDDIATIRPAKFAPVEFNIDTSTPGGATIRLRFYLYQPSSMRRLAELFTEAADEAEIRDAR